MSQQEASILTSIKTGKEEFTSIVGGWPGTTNPVKQERNITFSTPFPTRNPPKFLNLSVVGLDVGWTNDQPSNVRYKVYYENLDQNGFKLVVETWYSTIINLIQVEWLTTN
jgi:hypothetical protein